ncbi:MAG: SurA N-terminal domain-containing protein [Paracoccaceae bacterium]
MIRVIQLLAVGLLAAAYAMPAAAQGQFSPRVYVNDRVVTQYEVDQRYAFLQLLRAPGDVEDLAIRGLIDDRLRVQAAEEMGLKVSEEQIAAGMAEFAGRANLETEQLIELIGQAGIAPETLRDFVASGMIWRDVARGRFGPRAIVSDAEVDRALSLTSEKGGMRVLLSEIILPDTLDSIRLATELAGSITSQAALAAAAKEYSKSDSAAEGGRLN